MRRHACSRRLTAAGGPAILLALVSGAFTIGADGSSSGNPGITGLSTTLLAE